MQTFELRTKQATTVDGVQVAADTVVAIISTDHPISNILSLLSINQLSAIAVTLAAPAASINPPTAPSSLSPPNNTTTETNASATAVESNTTTTQPPNGSEKYVADLVASGLDERIAKSLVAEKLYTIEDVEAFVERGDDLVDLDGIGKAAKAKIEIWLANNAIPEE